MKDNEFMELLNLYLDHEISEADAARLEAEVQRTPARYQVYREYCRMHKACGLLSPAAIGEVPAAPAIDVRPRRWVNALALGGGLIAAAACVTFLFLSRAPTMTPASEGAAMAAKTPDVATPARSDAVAASNASPVSEDRAQLVSVSLDRSDFQAPLAIQTLRWNANDLVTAPNARLKWLEKLELTALPPVPADSLRFDVRPLPKNGARPFEVNQAEPPMEYNAIQFQR
jgi:hypothetical protein